MEKAKFNANAIRRILIAVFCIFIGTCVAVVMFRLYVPNQNALGALSSVCMDIICMIILCILICSFVFDNYRSNRTTWLFTGMLVATIWAMFLDFLNWAFDGSLEFGKLTFWFTVGSLCMGSILAGIFSVYLCSFMEENHGLTQMRIVGRVCGILNIISCILAFVLAVTGTAFQFIDGHYETGALYDVVTVIPVLSLVFLTGYVICHVKKIGFHDLFAVVGFIFFMIAGALIESSFRIGTTYVAVAIADIFIFIMLQNEIIAQEKRNAEEWMMKSNTDELTGFYNRHAYETDMSEFENSVLADDFIYVSVDVNSLKTVNDTIGHNAGDELIVGAAECLDKCFSTYGKLYRIGGDEFIAIIYADEQQLEVIKKDVEEKTKTWDGQLVHGLTMSCGYVSKREMPELSARQIAILADQRMYEAKKEYYQSTGIDRRKR